MFHEKPTKRRDHFLNEAHKKALGILKDDLMTEECQQSDKHRSRRKRRKISEDWTFENEGWLCDVIKKSTEFETVFRLSRNVVDKVDELLLLQMKL